MALYVKLSAEQVRAIRARSIPPSQYAATAAEFDVHANTIRLIVERLAWKDIL